jgi:penicillin-binding protein 1A
MNRFIDKHFKCILLLLGVVITILLGVLMGIILVFQKGFPQIENLEDINFKVMTVIYDDRGEPIREFAIEKRTLVRRSDIPNILVKALIASEDNQFYSHWGINFRGTMRAILGVLTGRNLGGGSSITQQLARQLFLTQHRHFFRKLQEMLMAIQIEKRYSKDQILTFYCNKIPLGSNIYGMEAGARYYFGKPVKEITLAEAAFLTAVIPNPYDRYNVFKNPGNCLIKRNYILERMKELKFITKDQLEEAVNTPLPQKPRAVDQERIGDYFAEDTRKIVAGMFGYKQLYTGGLRVYTTMNHDLQQWAEEALKEGLHALDKRRGWRGSLKNLGNLPGDRENTSLEPGSLPSWLGLKIENGKILEGIVLEVNNRRAIVKIGAHRGKLESADARWTKKKLSNILNPGDIALFRVLAVLKPPDRLNPDQKNQEEIVLKLGLEQEPEVEGAVLAVENETGEIKAMAGGYSFKRSQWNRATQALRQTGSTIKPIIYTAALEYGYTPAALLRDEPVIFNNQWTNEPYEPQNHTRDFVGPITLRRAFEQSRNVITTKIADYLTPPVILRFARNFGITSHLRPTMSFALGAYEVTLKEMVGAYTVFPNLGVRVHPFLIKKIVDQNDCIILENYPDKKRVIPEETAYIINYMMQGVVQWGTGQRAKYLPAPIGGKTGTTDDYTDAWFIGFSPSITVGVWVGMEMKESLGIEETGSRAAAPIFVRFMEKYLEKYGESEPREYRKPPGIIMVRIDKKTGKLITPDCLYPFREAFIQGTEPVDYCSSEDHEKIEDYYDDNGNEE